MSSRPPLPPEAMKMARQMLRDNPEKYPNIWKFYHEVILKDEKSKPEPKPLTTWQKIKSWFKR